MTLYGRAARFVAVFALLTLLYGLSAASGLERFLIETLTVEPAAQLLSWIAPELGVQANGARLSAPGGGLRVLRGCEGADLMFLVIAGVVAAPLRWRHRLEGAAAGLVLALAVNQLRVIALFFAVREAPSQFALLHGVATPLVMVLALAAWFAWHVRRRGAAVPLVRQ